MLAFCREHGKSSFFIMITTNLKWMKITSQLHMVQSASDIPVIITRIFRLHLKKSLEFIKLKFGTLVYLVKVIEFQVSDLPHAHTVLTLIPLSFISTHMFYHGN